MELVREALAIRNNHWFHRNLHFEPLEGDNMKKIDNPNFDRDLLTKLIVEMEIEEQAGEML